MPEQITEEQLKNAEVVEIPPTEKDFLEAYKALVNSTGFEIKAAPRFKLRDDGTFSVVVEYMILKINRVPD